MTQTSPLQRGSGPVQGFDTLHARILRFFPELVQDLGGDLFEVLREAGVSPDIFTESEAPATYRQMIHLIEQAATHLKCPDFGMQLAALQHGSKMFGPLGLVMKNAPTFGDALEYVSGHSYAHSLAARIWQVRARAEQGVYFIHDILLDNIPSKSQAVEQILLLGHLAAIEITGGYARVRKVHFRHQPVSPLKVYRRYFGCEVCFGENEDAVLFTDQDLARPVVSSDAAAYADATSFIESHFTQHRPPLHAQARGVIMHLLGDEDCNNERVAAELNLHPRTLHRRLKEEGTSFQQIKDEVRRDLMLYYLRETSLDFALISARLGFAEQSVMTRRCNRWFAASPTKVRAHRASLAPAL